MNLQRKKIIEVSKLVFLENRGRSPNERGSSRTYVSCGKVSGKFVNER